MKVMISDYQETREVNIQIDGYDLYNLDHTLALIIYPALKRFRNNTCGYPGCFDTEEKWIKILDKMIHAFDLLTKDTIDTEKDSKAIYKGLKLFAKYYCHLWS